MAALTIRQAAQDGQKPSIIAIMGCTGVGKSTFVKTIGAVSLEIDAKGPVVGDGLESCTAEPKLFVVPGTNIILIDTPGFNDTHVSDREMLRRISNLLATLHADRTDIAGLVYLHPIDDARVTGSAKKNLDMFRKVVGANNMNRCVLVTTKWCREQEAKAKSHEAELINNPSFWKEILDAGGRYARFEDTSHSAFSIISPLCKGLSIVPKVIVEWAHGGKRLHETEAGRAVEDDVERAKKLAQEDIKEVREETAEALRTKDFETAKTLDKERAELEGRLQKMEAEREKLRVEYEQQRREQDAYLEQQRKEAEIQRERAQKAQKEANDRWELQQRKFESQQKQKEADEKAWREQRDNMRKEEAAYREEQSRKEAKRGNRIERVFRRTALGVLGAGAVIITGGLAAPVIAVAAVAHEAKCQDEKDCE